MPIKDPNKFYSITMVAIFLSGLATALMSKETVKITLKNLAAGLCAGVVVAIVMESLKFSDGLIILSSNLMTAFATKFWPLLGDVFERWIKVKLNKLLGLEDPNIPQNGK